jgi:hypothetical protein
LLSVFGQREEVTERQGPSFAFSNAASVEAGSDTASSTTEVRAKMSRQSKQALQIDADPLLLSLSPAEVIIGDPARIKGGVASFRSLTHLQHKCADGPQLAKNGQPNLEQPVAGLNVLEAELTRAGVTMHKSTSLDKLIGHSRENQHFIRSTRNNEVQNQAIWSQQRSEGKFTANQSSIEKLTNDLSVKNSRKMKKSSHREGSLKNLDLINELCIQPKVGSNEKSS